MILREELHSIGHFTRPHGVQGEMALMLTDDVFDRADVSCLVCSMDGIFVPFFVEEYRYKTDNVVLVKFEHVDTVEQARVFTNKEAFALNKECEGEKPDFAWNDFVGFSAEDGTMGALGNIVHVDDMTMNVLFIVGRPDGSECFIPAQEVFIEDIDYENRHIVFNLPEGLID